MESEIELEPNKARALKSSLDDLELSYQEFLTDRFISEHFPFSGQQEFLAEAGWLTGRGDIDYRITVGEADEFVREHSDFNTWHELVDEALQEYYKASGRNRRDDQRRDCSIPVQVEAASETLSGTLLDLSSKGFRLQTDGLLPNTQLLQVQVNNPPNADRLILRGAIRWRNDGDNEVGVEILSKQKD